MLYFVSAPGIPLKMVLLNREIDVGHPLEVEIIQDIIDQDVAGLLHITIGIEEADPCH